MKYQATIIITGFHTLASDTSIMHQMPGPSRSSQLQYCSPCPSPPSPPTDEIRFQSTVASKWVQTSGTAFFPPTNAHNHRHERARVEAQAHVPGEAGLGYRLTSTRICAGCSEAWNRITAQRKSAPFGMRCMPMAQAVRTHAIAIRMHCWQWAPKSPSRIGEERRLLTDH